MTVPKMTDIENEQICQMLYTLQKYAQSASFQVIHTGIKVDSAVFDKPYDICVVFDGNGHFKLQVGDTPVSVAAFGIHYNPKPCAMEIFDSRYRTIQNFTIIGDDRKQIAVVQLLLASHRTEIEEAVYAQLMGISHSKLSATDKLVKELFDNSKTADQGHPKL